VYSTKGSPAAYSRGVYSTKGSPAAFSTKGSPLRMEGAGRPRGGLKAPLLVHRSLVVGGTAPQEAERRGSRRGSPAPTQISSPGSTGGSSPTRRSRQDRGELGTRRRPVMRWLCLLAEALQRWRDEMVDPTESDNEELGEVFVGYQRLIWWLGRWSQRYLEWGFKEFLLLFEATRARRCYLVAQGWKRRGLAALRKSWEAGQRAAQHQMVLSMASWRR